MVLRHFSDTARRPSNVLVAGNLPEGWEAECSGEVTCMLNAWQAFGFHGLALGGIGIEGS